MFLPRAWIRWCWFICKLMALPLFGSNAFQKSLTWRADFYLLLLCKSNNAWICLPQGRTGNTRFTFPFIIYFGDAALGHFWFSFPTVFLLVTPSVELLCGYLTNSPFSSQILRAAPARPSVSNHLTPNQQT